MSSNPTTSHRPPIGVLSVLSVLGAIGVWSYWPTLCGLMARWNSDPTYSHGFLVPFVAAAMIWQRRSLPVPSESSQPLLGLSLIAASLVLRVIGARFYFEALEWLSILPCVAGICVVCGGELSLRRAWPGIVFLVFLLPLPYRLEVALAGPLRSVATLVSTYSLQTLGYPAVAEGNVIVVGTARVGVAEACSGLRMLVSFFAVSAAVATFVKRPAWERGLIVLSAVPIAVLCNVSRVTITAALYETIGADLAHRLFHDLAGWLMMPLALGLLGIELWILSRLLVAPPERDVVPVGSGRRGMTAVYSEGVSPHSPGLPRIAATLGTGLVSTSLPQRGCVSFGLTQPLRGRCDTPAPDPRVAAMRGNPGLCDATPSE
ncbi:MAG: exosortase/archaeosortase family protein [Planctomycetaceae bacterium]